MGEPHPLGTRLYNIQPSIRTQDIDEIGDNRHTTFFNMMGNWSLNDYFKEDQLAWMWEFFTTKALLPKEKLHVSVFEGTDNVPKDDESYKIWQKLGLPTDHIHLYGPSKNWWSRSGTPDTMPNGEIGGPDSELFFDFGAELRLHEQSQWSSESCHPTVIVGVTWKSATRCLFNT
ncbi:MAG: Alanine--tRNA ligase [Microgenomates bacterium OLB23]|nr:MAG: Alanine--tRNA ligase [Microgenomates bacterium OLB23]